MPAVLRELDLAQRDVFGLVLSSSGVAHRHQLASDGWEIWVEDIDQLRALRAIDRYLEENRAAPGADSGPAAPAYGRSISGLAVAALLPIAHLAVLQSGMRRSVVQSCGAAADRILAGELERTVTALMLHADSGHLFGNIVGIALFGGAVASIWGWGLGWALVLASGAGGNLVNALAYQQGHLSIGASTAVFAAIGLLAVRNLARRHGDRRARFRAWIPLAAGLALLGMLGSSEKSDITAHLFGFAVGLGLGWLTQRLLGQPPARRWQPLIALGCLAVVALSWGLGLARL